MTEANKKRTITKINNQVENILTKLDKGEDVTLGELELVVSGFIYNDQLIKHRLTLINAAKDALKQYMIKHPDHRRIVSINPILSVAVTETERKATTLDKEKALKMMTSDQIARCVSSLDLKKAREILSTKELIDCAASFNEKTIMMILGEKAKEIMIEKVLDPTYKFNTQYHNPRKKGADKWTNLTKASKIVKQMFAEPRKTLFLKEGGNKNG